MALNAIHLWLRCQAEDFTKKKHMIRADIVSDIEAYFDRLWPLNRSITGADYRASLSILSEVIPLEVLAFQTGETVLDWTIPNEWNVQDAYITDPRGEKVCDFKRSNLHLMGYSVPINKRMLLSELREHLYYLKDQPEAIPYVTSYYEERWGFCLSYDQYQTLEEGEYHVVIDATLEPGKLTVGEAVIRGEREEEVFFSSYLCHPSMANNELSGPLVLAFLYDALSRRDKPKYTLRFALVPETIGAVAYLSKRGFALKEQCIAGYQLSCIGDGGDLTYKKSRRGESLADRVALRILSEHEPNIIMPFNPAIGSDERQYCSPGFDLPVGSFMRTMYTVFPEYHTSLDNKSLMDFEKMSATVDVLVSVVDSIEKNVVFENQLPFGEPQLSPRGLFRSISDKTREKDEMAMWWLLNYGDGTNDLLDIAELSGYDVDVLYRVGMKLLEKGIFKLKS